MDTRKNIYLFYVKDSSVEKKLVPFVQIAEENGFEIVKNSEDANIIISIGGDGAFLQAVRQTGFRQDCLYMGIKNDDEAGLYCDFDLNSFDEMVHIMMNEDLEVRRFPILNVSVNNDESQFNCLNELSIRSSIIKSFVLDVFIDHQFFETFRGDGLIVSTPTGSTGYNKSSNGAVMDPKLQGFQVTELASLNNNRYRTLGASFILSGDRTLRFEIIQDGNDYPIIGLDNEAYSIRNIKTLDMSLSKKHIKTIKLKNNTFWDRVKRTFL
ncbi:NAD kinase [Salinibacillus aidingensis]|uniref:NAD kinase n=1 Tax=Salinibacillus aidingensis TaxID=237684 RepID=A0ABN1AV57_9BACI